MRGILILCAVVIVAGAVAVGVAFSRPDRYGEQVHGAELADVGELLRAPDSYVGKPLTVEGIVRKQCRSSGCFFFFQAGDRTLRIEMGDVVNSLPQRVGYRARVEGELGKRGDELEFYGRSVEFFRNS